MGQEAAPKQGRGFPSRDVVIGEVKGYIFTCGDKLGGYVILKVVKSVCNA
jgi:hypothetical protein